ncbi:hypothetical protein BT63DRAFT_426518 [Microthyrium microscopicum]|uniref:Metallothionein-I gene transcription activator n=1 Tax=Microthyrium microscopicum TaxID=703497 RepID=A0A6A6U5Z3_9PEZI|nr:hypothetical protein BT63DRAFT_426518 [Microthyrium microscopicum]
MSNPYQAQQAASSAAAASANAGFTNYVQEKINNGVNYVCGDCDSKVTLKTGDIVRCKQCGHRVLYKMRTDQIVQFEAR